MEQKHTCQHAAAVNENILDAWAAIRNENLNGLIHAGRCRAPNKGGIFSLSQHTEAPGQEHTQCGEFRKMGEFAQQAAAGRILGALLKEHGQKIFHPVT